MFFPSMGDARPRFKPAVPPPNRLVVAWLVSGSSADWQSAVSPDWQSAGRETRH